MAKANGVNKELQALIAGKMKNSENKAFMNANEVWKLARQFGGISVQYGS